MQRKKRVREISSAQAIPRKKRTRENSSAEAILSNFLGRPTRAVLVTLSMLAVLFPLYWVVTSSLKLERDYLANPPVLIPSQVYPCQFYGRIYQQPAGFHLPVLADHRGGHHADLSRHRQHGGLRAGAGADRPESQEPVRAVVPRAEDVPGNRDGDPDLHGHAGAQA